MCIAILNDKKKTIDFLTLQNCWNNNQDGAGMLWTENGVLFHHKEMKDFNAFYDKYLQVRQDNEDSRIVLHFRISTHGKVNKTNCHPFLVNDELGFVHNGIISGLPHSKDYSDTYQFNKYILKKMPSDFLKHSGVITLIEEFISYSKLIFLDANNEYTIVGEEKGIWDDGNWFSNSTYRDLGYYDVGGKKVWKTQTTVFDDEPVRHGNYGQVWGGNNSYQKSFKGWEKGGKLDGGASYANGVTRSYADNHKDFYDDAKDVKDSEYSWRFEHDEPCECCQNLSDVVKFSETYKLYCCKECWNEFVENEGTFNDEVNLNVPLF